MSELPAEHEEMSHHDTVEEAKAGGHELVRLLGGLPAGWALYIAGDDDRGYDVVRYQP